MGVIAVATNFTERSDRALRRAAILARSRGDELLIVHVLEGGASAVDREAAESKLSAISGSVGELEGVQSKTEIRSGPVAERICEAAKGANAYLTVVGAHRAVLRDMVDDTPAQTLVRRCTLPVLSANCFPAGNYRRAMLATDLSEENLRCIRKLGELPPLSLCQRIVIHVYDPEALTMLGRAFADGEERRAYLLERGSDAEAELRDWVDKAGLPAAERQVRASVGSFPDDILAAAKEQSVDLIVACKRKEGAVKRAVVGSVTDALLANVEVDVLVMPPAD